MPSLDTLLKDTLLFASGTQPRAAPPGTNPPVVPACPETVLEALSDDAVLRKCIWQYERVGLRCIRNLAIRNRTLNDQLMQVCDSIEWGPVQVVHQGRTYDLPLEEDFLVRSHVLDWGEVPGSDDGLWQLPANLHGSCQLVFAYEAPRDASRTDWVKPTEETLGDYRFMPYFDRSATIPLTGTSAAGGSAPVYSIVVAPMRVVVVLTLACCTERRNYDPAGAAGSARLYPLVMAMANMPVDSIGCSISVERPATSSMPCHSKDGEMPGEIAGSFFSDRNSGGVLGGGGILNSVPAPYWDDLFAYYLAEPSPSEKVTMVDRTKSTRRDIEKANEVYESDPTDRLSPGYEWRSIYKLPFQGEFDNLHVAPRFRVPTPPFALERWRASYQNIVMAPFCIHDCLHLHTRWADDADAKHNMGWSEAGPNSRQGAPMVPPNQTVKIEMTSPSAFRYVAEAHQPAARSWQVFMHHGMGYAISTNRLIDGAQRAHRFVKANPHGFSTTWAQYYWDLRYSTAIPIASPAFLDPLNSLAGPELLLTMETEVNERIRDGGSAAPRLA